MNLDSKVVFSISLVVAFIISCLIFTKQLKLVQMSEWREYVVVLISGYVTVLSALLFSYLSLGISEIILNNNLHDMSIKEILSYLASSFGAVLMTAAYAAPAIFLAAVLLGFIHLGLAKILFKFFG